MNLSWYRHISIVIDAATWRELRVGLDSVRLQKRAGGNAEHAQAEVPRGSRGSGDGVDGN